MSVSAVTSPDHRYGRPRIRVRTWRAVGLLAGVALLAACSSSSTSSSSGGSGGSAAANSTFCQGGVTDVSYAGPMSGAEATYGQEQYDGLSLAVSLFNSAGGFTAGPLKGCKVKVLGPYDDESEPSTGATIATRL